MEKDIIGTSRRAALRTGLAAVGAGLVASAMTSKAQAQATEKLAQNLVQYQAVPKDGAQCNKCVNWVEPNACTIVAGEIAPAGWCVAYAPKES